MWVKRELVEAQQQISELMDVGCTPIGYSHNKLTAVEKLLRMNLLHGIEASPPDLLPFKNGVLQISTRKILEHDSKYFLTWQLPYKYDIQAKAGPVINWLTETLSGDKHQVEVIRAFGKAILVGQISQMQKYIELIGAAGSGKSTLIRMLAIIVGQEAYYTTSLKALEKSPFETANLHGKRLAAITDAETYSGDVTTLKAATGGDDLRYEVKNVQASKPFKFIGGLILAANQDVQSSDHSNGLQRRRITLRLNVVINPEDMKDLDPLFIENAAGIVNWMLDMEDEEMVKYLKTPEKMSAEIRKARKEQMLNTDSLYRWFNDNIELVPGHRSYIGNAIPFHMNLHPNICSDVNEKLYPNYQSWAQGEAIKKTVSLQTFSKNLECLLVEKLTIPGIKKHHDSKGKYIEGIKIKSSIEVETANNTLESETPNILDIRNNMVTSSHH